MLRSSYKILTVWGIPIRLHISLVALIAFLAYDFGRIASAVFDISLIAGIAMQLKTVLLLELGLLTSIALHELGHSIVAIKKGCRVREILLMPIGGAARMESMPTRPRDECLMAIAGPAVSLVLGVAGVRWGGYVPAPMVPYFVRDPINVFQLLGGINIGLVFFNLLPSFPMDGGRVLRAILTPKFGRLKATYIAARLGRFMAILFGLFALFGYDEPSWTLFAIALFIYIIAGNEYKMVAMQEAAKRQGPFSGGFGESEQPPTSWWSNDADSDRVVVSPPPYDNGPASETDIHPEDRSNPFGSFFNR